MSKLQTVIRLLMGLIFFVFGLNGFLNFIPAPPMPDKAQAFFMGLLGSGYFFPFLKGTEVVCSLALLSGAMVPLALVILAPIIINIFLFHLFLAPSGLTLAIPIGLMEIYLAFFSPMYSPIVKQIFRCPLGEMKAAERAKT